LQRPSGLHLIDPRIKLAGFLLLGVATFLTEEPAAVVAAFTLVLFAAVASSVHPGALIIRTRYVFWFVAVILIANAFTVSGHILFHIFGVYATEEGVYRGTLLASRIVLLLWMSVLLIATTPVIDFTDAIASITRPLGNRWHALSTMISLTVNYVPSFIRSARRIKLAQIARGADVDSGVIAQIRYAFSAALPLFVSALRTSSRLALAMEARGFDAGRRRTLYRELRMARRDWFVLAVCLTFATLMIAWSFR
jgi:energy-coupling factor transport system permease protein